MKNLHGAAFDPRETKLNWVSWLHDTKHNTMRRLNYGDHFDHFQNNALICRTGKIDSHKTVNSNFTYIRLIYIFYTYISYNSYNSLKHACPKLLIIKIALYFVTSHFFLFFAAFMIP